MALRFGLPLRDMEMVQFHPTGLARRPAYPDDRYRAGGRTARGRRLPAHGDGERFMDRYDARAERATRDIVSRAIDTEMRSGRTTPNGGVYLSMGHLGPDNVRRQFRGHGRALRRLRLRPRGRPRRGRSHRALHDGRRRVRPRLHDGDSPDSSSPAKIRAGCTARTGWAATALRIRRSSAASRATRSRRGSRRRAHGANRMPRRSKKHSCAPRLRCRADAAIPCSSDRFASACTTRCGTMPASFAMACGSHALAERSNRSPTSCRASASRRRARVQPHLARRAQPRESHRRVARDRSRGRRHGRIPAVRTIGRIFPTTATLPTSDFVRVRQRDGGLAAEAVPVRFTRVAPGGTLRAD